MGGFVDWFGWDFCIIGKGKKAFFFEKKKQKTFALWWVAA